jgi:hypothetical protein
MAGSPRGRYWRAALTGRGHAAIGLKQAQNIQLSVSLSVNTFLQKLGPKWQAAQEADIGEQL